MKITNKKELLDLLYEIQSNCGDNRGRDGEYLSDSIDKAINLAEYIDCICEE